MWKCNFTAGHLSSNIWKGALKGGKSAGGSYSLGFNWSKARAVPSVMNSLGFTIPTHLNLSTTSVIPNSSEFSRDKMAEKVSLLKESPVDDAKIPPEEKLLKLKDLVREMEEEMVAHPSTGRPMSDEKQALTRLSDQLLEEESGKGNITIPLDAKIPMEEKLLKLVVELSKVEKKLGKLERPKSWNTEDDYRRKKMELLKRMKLLYDEAISYELSSQSARESFLVSLILPRLEFHLKISLEFRHMRYGDDVTQLIVLSKENRLYMSGCFDSPDITKLSLTQIKPSNDSAIKFIGSCNGLMCLLVDDFKIFVLNPCTKQVVELPPCALVERQDRGNHLIFGFGYDDLHDDYKVVRLQNVDSKQPRHEAKVYSLRSKRWRDIENGVGNYISACFGGTDRGVLTNGALHWLMTPNSRARNADNVVALDLATERYRTVPLPEEAKDFGGDFVNCLGEMDGCLSLIHKQRNEDEKKYYFHLWMMKNYGVKDSWKKLTLQPQKRTDPDYLSPQDLLCCNFDARAVKPVMPSKNFFVFRAPEGLKRDDGEDEADDLILWDPVTWKGVYTFTPSLVKFPA